MACFWSFPEAVRAQGGGERDAGRALEVGQPVPGPGQQLRLGHARAALAGRAVLERVRVDDAHQAAGHRASGRTQAVLELGRGHVVGRAEEGEAAGRLGQAVGLQELAADRLGGRLEHGQRDRRGAVTT